MLTTSTTTRATETRLGRAGAFVVVVALVAIAANLAGCGDLSSASGSAATPQHSRPPSSSTASTTNSSSATSTTISAATRALNTFYQVPRPLDPAPPGSIIRSERIATDADLPPTTTSYRVLYHSESISGADIAVSGTVVVPGGPAPSTGFPILAWAHGTTGLAGSCAPSRQGTATIDYLSHIVADGIIVAATDYESLGTPGTHPYLVGQSEGQGVLDAARAARNLEGSGASDAVLIDGYSQGGHAALFAGQIARSYAPDLFVVGIIAVAPVVSADAFASADPGPRADPFDVYTLMALYAWSVIYPDLPLSGVLTSSALAALPSMNQRCSDAEASVFSRIPTNRLFEPGWTRAPGVRTYLSWNDPGAAPTMAPILVVQGTSDPLITFASTSALVSKNLCHDEHDRVQYDAFSGTDHGSVVTSAEPAILRWIADRIAGRPAPDSCGQKTQSLPMTF
jgi:Secretory lipase